MARRLTRRGALMLGVHPAFEDSVLESFGRTETEIRAATGDRPGLFSRSTDLARLAISGEALVPPKPRSEALAHYPRTAVSAEFESGYVLADGLACIRVEGCLTADGYYDWFNETWQPGYAQIAAAIEAAGRDDRVAGVFMMIDSPGGLVTGAWSLAEYIRASRSDAGGKPIIAWVRMAASAAQLIAAQADACYAEDGADMGSIGVRASFLDYSKYLEKEGIAANSFVSGRLKDIYSQTRPPTDEERAIIQADVNDHARRFFDHVAAGRGLDAATVKSWEARLFCAGASGDADAEAAGLIDGILNEDEAFAAARALAGLAAITDGSQAGAGRAAQRSGAARRGSKTTAAAMEKTMTELEKRLAALKAKADRGDKAAKAEWRRLKGLLAEGGAPEEEAEGEDDESAEGDEGDQSAEGEDDDQSAEGEDDDQSAEGEDDDETAEGEDDKEALAQQLIATANKQGKPAFGQRLAIGVASGRRSYASALADLKAAARETNPLKAAMSGGRGGAAPEGESRPKPAAGLAAAMDKRLGVKRDPKAS